jgi:hypothetical protein
MAATDRRQLRRSALGDPVAVVEGIAYSVAVVEGIA